jgi:hypothetical protein
MGDLTADITFDASSAEMQSHLKGLDAIGAVSVTRIIQEERLIDIEELECMSKGGVTLPMA